MPQEVRYFPEEFAAHYRAVGYWNEETFADFLPRAATRFARNEAVIGKDYRGRHHRLNYREFDEHVARFAGGLRAADIGPGDVVVLQLPNTVDYLVAVFAIFRIGAIPLFTLPAHRRADIQHFLKESEAKGYIVAGRHAGFDYREMADELETNAHIWVADEDPGKHRSIAELHESTHLAEPVEVAPESLAFLQLSGGTTGTPKLIPRTHADYLYSVRESARICELDEHTRMLVVLPVSHNFTMSSPGVLGVLWAGGTCVMCPDPTPSTGMRLIEEEKITLTSLVPPLAMSWLAARPRIEADISSLEVLQVGGAKFVAEAARRVTPELGCRLQQVFGMAEGLVNYTRPEDSEEIVTGTQGRPISPDDEIRVLTPEGEAVEPGERGVLYTRGPYTIRGYFKGIAAESFTEDGFYCTGDVVRQLPSGHLVVEGRVKDQINRAGEKISAEELENDLVAHPLILDAAVVGIPDDYLGEQTCAYLLVNTPATAPGGDEIRDFLRSRGVAEFKLPDRIDFAESFPATAVGKVSRKALRLQLSQWLSRV